MEKTKINNKKFLKEEACFFIKKITDRFRGLSKEIKILFALTAVAVLIAFLPPSDFKFFFLIGIMVISFLVVAYFLISALVAAIRPKTEGQGEQEILGNLSWEFRVIFVFTVLVTGIIFFLPDDSDIFPMVSLLVLLFLIVGYFFLLYLLITIKNFVRQGKKIFQLVRNFAGGIRIENVVWKNGAIVLTIIKKPVKKIN